MKIKAAFAILAMTAGALFGAQTSPIEYTPSTGVVTTPTNPYNFPLGTLINSKTLATSVINGVEDSSKFSVGYVEGTRVYTLTTTSGAAYWIGGLRYTPAAAVTAITAHDDTTGIYYLRYATNTPATATSLDFEANTVIAYNYYNATANKAVLFDERHPNTWPWSIHRYEHLTGGAKLISGGTISGQSLDTGGDAATSFAIAETVIDDESLRHTLTALADGGPYTVWYRSGTDSANEWSWTLTSTVPYLDDGDNPYYNRLNTGTWSNVAVSGNSNWVNYWLFAVNAYNDAGDNYKQRFVLVMGQNTHTTLAAARAEDVTTGISWGIIPATEIVPLYKITFQHVNDGANKDAQIDEVTQIVGPRITLTSNTGEVDTLATVTARGANSASSVNLYGATPLTVGADVAAGTTNVPGWLKFFSNGDNAYYTTFTAGTQSANATYTLPTAMPGSDMVLQSTSAGVLSWVNAALSGGGAKCFSFTLPTDGESDALTFEIDIDNDADFASPIISWDTRAAHEGVTGCYVFDGTNWIGYPALGAGAAYYGKRVSFTTTSASLLTGTLYFIRYRCYDGTGWTSYTGSTETW